MSITTEPRFPVFSESETCSQFGCDVLGQGSVYAKNAVWSCCFLLACALFRKAMSERGGRIDPWDSGSPAR